MAITKLKITVQLVLPHVINSRSVKQENGHRENQTKHQFSSFALTAYIKKL